MSATVNTLLRYPVKGLSAERLQTVELVPGESMPNDRRFAIAHGSAIGLDPANPEWMPKANFLQLMSNEKLATLETRFDTETGFLTVSRNGRQVSRGRITENTGCAVLEQFFAAYMGGEIRGQPRLVECEGQAFSDTPEPFLSVINLASVRDLERVVGRVVDPTRFRGNILIEGVPAWCEFDWIGQSFKFGSAVLFIEKRTGRCAATNVDPTTGNRDLTLPRSMQHAFGHEDCGVYARVMEGGSVSVDDPLTPK
ncbi:MAG: MOSC domain-containing protein [Rhodospirillaceae bacterium]|nr:MOSC domain-containing protein [Rhodospirillaceae bacterium]